MLASTAVPLPDSSQDIQCLLSKFTAYSDVEVFLSSFERVAIQKGWYSPSDSAPLLHREAQQACYALTDKEAFDCLILKDEILAHCGLSPTRAATEFQHWAYHQGHKPQG